MHFLAQSSPPDIAVTVLFYVFALMSAASAIGLVISRNIVRTAVALLFTLLGVGGLYFLLDAEFLAAVQLVVYAGGTLILIVFGVMLTSKSPFSRFEPKLAEVIVALSVAAVLLIALLMAINNARPTFGDAAQPTGQRYPVDLLGQALLGDYLVPFELASVLLLVVMIGAAYLAKARKREPADEVPAVAAELSRQAKQWS
jgi:NADH-quinone oxidoreductase subunit J